MKKVFMQLYSKLLQAGGDTRLQNPLSVGVSPTEK